jgi:hypothetical protein
VAACRLGWMSLDLGGVALTAGHAHSTPAAVYLWLLRLRSALAHRRLKIGRIEIIVTGEPNDSKERIAPGIGQCGPHPPRGSRIGNGAIGPVGGDSLPGHMSRDRCRVKQAGRLIEGVVCPVAISCWPRTLRRISSPLESGA